MEFLDIIMDLERGEYGPFRKPNDKPIYVSSGSNHPPRVLENIPKGINKRLTNISATKEIFDKAAPVYQEALKESGFNYQLKFEPCTRSEPKRNRKRSIIWFNPPYSRNVATNVGEKFLQIMDKHFPPENPLHKIFNRNSVKMSYRCTPNLARKISAHNSKILNPVEAPEQGPNVAKKECSCRKTTPCPVEGKCLSEGVVYQATVIRDDGVTDNYIGLTAGTFKDRWTKHKSNFKTRNPKNATALSRYVWKLQDEKIKHHFEWRIVSRAKPFNHVSGVCNLCVREKYFIVFKPQMATINARN